MKTKTQNSFSTNPSRALTNSHPQHRDTIFQSPRIKKQESSQIHLDDNPSIIQIATSLVDSVANMLCQQIKYGILQVDEDERPLYIKRQQKQQTIQQKVFDPEQHKQLVLKFVRERQRIKKERQMKYLQRTQKQAKALQQQQKQRAQSYNKSLQDRRNQIVKRLQSKKNMANQITKNYREQNHKIQQIKSKKFLYQQKQQQFYKNVILPKIQAQNKILQKKKQIRNPINMTELYKHQESYAKIRQQKQASRSISLSLMESKDFSYEPPHYVPKSYRMVQKQQLDKAQYQRMKSKQHENILKKKKQYIKALNQLRKQQQVKSQQHSQTIESKSKQKKSKSKPKTKMNRQQMVNAGNQYLKQLLQQNRNIAKSRKLKPINFQQQQLERYTINKGKLKSEQQIQILKNQRENDLQKIRSKRITEILNSKRIDERQKYYQLQVQIQRLDQLADKMMKSDNKNIYDQSNAAGILCSSIQAKLAYLRLSGNQ